MPRKKEKISGGDWGGVYGNRHGNSPKILNLLMKWHSGQIVLRYEMTSAEARQFYEKTKALMPTIFYGISGIRQDRPGDGRGRRKRVQQNSVPK